MSAMKRPARSTSSSKKTGKLMKKITLSNHPNNIAVTKDGRIVVGIARGTGALDIIDPVKLEVEKTIPTQWPPAQFAM